MKQRIQHTFRTLGWLNGVCYGVAVVLDAVSRQRWSLHSYLLVAQPVLRQPLAGRRGAAIETRRVLDAAAMAPSLARSPSVLLARQAQGARCITAQRGTDVLGFMWYTPGAYQEDEVRARFRPACIHGAWDFDIEVFAPYRMGPAFARLWDEANRQLCGLGVRWSCSRISAFNAGSRAAHARLGSRLLGRALFLRCANWQWMAASVPPYFHLSRHSGSFPLITLETPCCTPNKSNVFSATP